MKNFFVFSYWADTHQTKILHSSFSFFILLVAASAFASAVVATFVIAATTAAVSTSAATTAAHHAGYFSQLFIGCQTAGYYFAYEVQVASGQGMVHIHYYHIVLYFYHTAVDALSFGCHQRNNGSFYYTFAVEFSIYQENVFGKSITCSSSYSP